MAGGAGALNGEEALLGAHASAAVAGLAADRLSAAFRAAAVAGFTGHRARHADLRGLASEGVFEGDFHVVAKVGTPRRLAAAPPAHEVAEHLVADVGEAAGREAPEAAAARRPGAIGEGVMADRKSTRLNSSH